MDAQNSRGWSMREKQGTWISLEDNGFGRRNGLLEQWQRSLRKGRRVVLQLVPRFCRTQSINSTTLSLPVSIPTVRFVFLCSLWYMSSAMSSNTGKAILNQFRYPVTLTFVQFGFVAGYCLLFMSPAFRISRLRAPTRAIIRSTVPMAVFQVGGHIFSSVAIGRIPVSTVHTIKALSPLFTVGAYAVLFRVRYSIETYVSLLPLTLGVMMACSSDFSASNILGLLSAFGSALVFVSSNIFFKKIMPSPSSVGSITPAHKLDKLNLLFYSSGFAFLLMIPVWLYSDLNALLSPLVIHPPHSSSHGILYYFFWNGTVHFGQNIIAFVILSTTSPVTYSIASLIKRIAVIIIAIAWFNQTVHPTQAFGIALTSAGLWMYNRAKGDVEKGEKKMLRLEAERQLMLPTTERERMLMDPTVGLSISNEVNGHFADLYRGGLTISTSINQNHTHVSSTTASHPPLGASLHPPQSQSSAHPNISRHEFQMTSNVSPTILYPSPPPSIDSPPDDTRTFHTDYQPQIIQQQA